jgi:20S proteasome alpha/beta subunit
MSVTVGITCNDGIVLAADQQISVPDYSKHHEHKIDGKEGKGWTVAYAYAGSPSLMKEATQKILDKLDKNNQHIETEVVHAVAESVLEEMGYKFAEMDLELLICTTTQSDLKLLRFDGKGKALYVATGIEILGVADSSLLKYLADGLYEEGKTDLAFGVPLAIYMVEKAKAYVNYCGGQTDLLIVKAGNILDSWKPFECVAPFLRMQACEKEYLRRIIERGVVTEQ